MDQSLTGPIQLHQNLGQFHMKLMIALPLQKLVQTGRGESKGIIWGGLGEHLGEHLGDIGGKKGNGQVSSSSGLPGLHQNLCQLSDSWHVVGIQSEGRLKELLGLGGIGGN